MKILRFSVEFRDGDHLRRNYLSSTPYGGLMVPATASLQVGDIVELQVRCAGNDFARRIRGAVLWRRKDTGIAFVAGVGFFASEVEKRECLLSLCSNALSTDRERKNERYEIDFKVAYKATGDFVVDCAKNISAGGFFIESQDPLPLGTSFLFELYLPGEDKPIGLPGKVVWLDETGRFGVHFAPSDPNLRDRLDKIVRRVALEASQGTADSASGEAATN